jgi:hypothetical protein
VSLQFNGYILTATELWYRGIIDVRDQQRLQELAEKVLGPKNLRTSARPTLSTNKTYKGGTAFERSPRAEGVKGSRCYTNAYSHQIPPNIVSVTQGSKRNGVPDDNLDLRKEINLVRYLGSALQPSTNVQADCSNRCSKPL